MIIYLLVSNVVAFFGYGLDKFKAKHHLWRIPEYVLLLLAASGGSVGAYLAMQIFRHKTKHLKFKYGIPIIIVIQLVLLKYYAD